MSPLLRADLLFGGFVLATLCFASVMWFVVIPFMQARRARAIDSIADGWLRQVDLEGSSPTTTFVETGYRQPARRVTDSSASDELARIRRRQRLRRWFFIGGRIVTLAVPAVLARLAPASAGLGWVVMMYAVTISCFLAWRMISIAVAARKLPSTNPAEVRAAKRPE